MANTSKIPFKIILTKVNDIKIDQIIPAVELRKLAKRNGYIYEPSDQSPSNSKFIDIKNHNGTIIRGMKYDKN